VRGKIKQRELEERRKGWDAYSKIISLCFGMVDKILGNSKFFE